MRRPLQFRRPRRILLFLFLVLPLALALPFTLWVSLALSPLQKQYLPVYVALTTSGKSGRALPVQWIWKMAAKRSPELAEDADVVSASPGSQRKSLPLALSAKAQAAGWTGLLRAKQSGSARGEQAALEDEFFGGRSLARMMMMPLCGTGGILLLFFAWRMRSGSQARQEERHGRRTKGPELSSAFRWARRGTRAGIRLRLAGKFGLPGPSFLIPQKLEASHILLMGDTGSGKSNAIRQILRQVQTRGETAIVYDPAGEFVQEFYRPERGDLILNPLDTRCPYWSLRAELDSRGMEDAIAAAMLPDKPFESGFFTDAPRRVLAALLRKEGATVTLLEWMANPAEIERRLEGTPQAVYLDRKAGPQRAGVLSSLNMIADSLALLPTGDESRVWFDTGRWRYERTRWVFLTSRPALRERILPLHSAWLDLFILRMMEPCANPAKPVWFVLDELASLNKLPQLHTAVTENRKYGNPVVLGFQGRSQLEKRYDQDAEAMLSQPATKIFFKTSEPRAAKWISDTLGEIEVERLRESQTPGLIGSTRNYAMEVTTKPLVMASEIAGLESLHGYIKQGNRVIPARFKLVKRRSLQPEFLERKMTVPEPRQLPLGIAAVPDEADGQASQLAPPPRKEEPTKPAPPLYAQFAFEEPIWPEEHRNSAFKSKNGKAREWKPLD